MDLAYIAKQAIERCDQCWDELPLRLAIVPGKQLLSSVRDRIQKEYGVTLTIQRIVTAFRREEIPEDLGELLEKLEEFRKTKY